MPWVLVLLYFICTCVYEPHVLYILSLVSGVKDELLPLQEEHDEGPNSLPEEGFHRRLLLQKLPFRNVSYQQTSHQDVSLLPQVSLCKTSLHLKVEV